MSLIFHWVGRGYDEGFIHAHHIVQKYFNPAKAAAGSAAKPNRHWWIRESQKILEDAGIEVWKEGTEKTAMALAKKGKSQVDKFANFAWATNGNKTHTNNTIETVYTMLSEVAGDDKAVREVLGDIRGMFHRGELLFEELVD